MKGYKVFNNDWTCRGYQFEVGKTFEEDVTPKSCERGFHFCAKAVDCFQYYDFNPENKVAEVEALGVVDNPDGEKSCTNKLRIIREITWYEVLELVNTGHGNIGRGNTGDENTGHHNTGNGNTGHHNTGNGNTGHRNTGNGNTGHRNTGDFNTGDFNTGYRNIGCENTGDDNTGHYNTCRRNTGNRNTGYQNTGHHNTGDFNAGDFNTGCFNTETKKLNFFDKETDVTFAQWRTSGAFTLLHCNQLSPTVWINTRDMTAEEKLQNPEYETAGGYLKVQNNKTRYIKWWDALSGEEKNIIKGIPNFNAEKFYAITGIKVEG